MGHCSIRSIQPNQTVPHTQKWGGGWGRGHPSVCFWQLSLIREGAKNIPRGGCAYFVGDSSSRSKLGGATPLHLVWGGNKSFQSSPASGGGDITLKKNSARLAHNTLSPHGNSPPKPTMMHPASPIPPRTALQCIYTCQSP